MNMNNSRLVVAHIIHDLFRYRLRDGLMLLRNDRFELTKSHDLFNLVENPLISTVSDKHPVAGVRSSRRSYFSNRLCFFNNFVR